MKAQHNLPQSEEMDSPGVPRSLLLKRDVTPSVPKEAAITDEEC
jgi:hypothetical protein